MTAIDSWARRVADAWSSADPDRVVALFTPDGVRHEYGMTGAMVTGADALREHAAGYLRAVPDAAMEIRNAFAGADGERVLEWTFRGTHTGEVPGLPAGGGAVVVDGMSVCVMDGELVREERDYFDSQQAVPVGRAAALTGARDDR